MTHEAEIHWGDLHLIFDDTVNVCKVFRKGTDGGPLFTCEMRNATTAAGFGRHGWCPRGTFLVGEPSGVHLVPFGHFFTPLFDLDLSGPMHDEGRKGIGIHGGGSGLADPFAARQGWMVTHGCLRVQNEDNAHLVTLLRAAYVAGHRCFITVGGQAG